MSEIYLTNNMVNETLIKDMDKMDQSWAWGIGQLSNTQPYASTTCGFNIYILSPS